MLCARRAWQAVLTDTLLHSRPGLCLGDGLAEAGDVPGELCVDHLQLLKLWVEGWRNRSAWVEGWRTRSGWVEGWRNRSAWVEGWRNRSALVLLLQQNGILVAVSAVQHCSCIILAAQHSVTLLLLLPAKENRGTRDTLDGRQNETARHRHLPNNKPLLFNYRLPGVT